jgi:hypothetical protein
MYSIVGPAVMRTLFPLRTGEDPNFCRILSSISSGSAAFAFPSTKIGEIKSTLFFKNSIFF